MSTVKANNHQIGQSLTATNNFSWYQPSSPDGTVRLGVGNAGATTSDVVTINSSGNLGLGGASFASGTLVMFIANRTAAPSGTPSGGGVLYVESGALKYKGSSGTVTTLANA